MKRILSLVLILSMLVPQAVMAQKAADMQVLLNETYIDAPTSSLPDKLSSEGDGSVLYVQESAGNKNLVVKNRWVDTKVRYSVNATKGNLWIDIKAMYADNNTNKNIIELEGNETVALLKISASGIVSDYRGNSICRVNKNEWHRYTVCVNLDTKRYDIYVDGKPCARRIALAKKPAFEKIGFTMLKNPDAESVMYNDYLRVYTGEKIASESAFEVPAWNDSKKKPKKTVVEKPENKVKLIFSQDFEAQAAKTVPTGYSATDGEQYVMIEQNGNHYYNIEWTEEDSGMTLNMNGAQISMSETPKQFVMQADVRLGKSYDDIFLYGLRDAATPYHFSHTVTLKPDGTLKLYNGKSLGNANCKNNWVNIAVACDFETHLQDYYINGKLVAEDVAFEDKATVNRMQVIRFYKSTNLGKGNFQLDNMRIYSGLNLVSAEELAETGTDEMPEKIEEWKTEITPAKLNVKTENFEVVPDYESTKTNDYLVYPKIVTSNFDNTIVMVAKNNRVWINDAKYLTPYRVEWDNEHFIAPAELLASFSNESVTVSGNTARIGTGFTATVGEKKIKVLGKEYETPIAVQFIDGKIYIPVREYVIYKLKKYYSETYRGLAVIADKQINLNASAQLKNVVQMLAYMILDLPNSQKIKEALDISEKAGVHPRTIVTDEHMNRVIEDSKKDETLKSYLDYFLDLGKQQLDSKQPNVFTMYVNYKATGDEAYAQKAVEYIKQYIDTTTWKPRPYDLNSSEYIRQLTYMYDFFYDELTQETKDKLANEIIEKGLKPVIVQYYGGTSDWPIRKTNWNSVCNAGAILAAAALLGDGYNDELCLEVIEMGVRSLYYQLYMYAPMGALPESIGYWGYGHGYLLPMITTLENTFNNDFGITDYPGFMEAGYFPYYVDMGKDIWPLHDDTLGGSINNAYSMWHAYRTNDMELQRMRVWERTRKKYAVDANDLLYYMPGDMPEKPNIPLDANYSHIELATSRSGWNTTAFVMGVHAGDNSVEHGQKDMGNFIYEAYGLRFAQDIGRDDYNLPLYHYQDERRYTYYAHRAEGHNVFVVNPSEFSGQLFKAKSEVEVLVQKPRGVIYSVDLLPAYYGSVVEAKRGYMFTNDRSVLVVQDEIIPKAQDDEYKWFWTTDADITINDDNTVTLSRDYKTVTLHFDSNVPLEFEKGKTTPLPTSPNDANQLKIGNVANKLTVNFLSEAEKVYLRCTAVPYGYEYDVGELVPFTEWTIPDGEYDTNYNTADMIYIDGVPLENFQPETYDYTMFHPGYKKLPTVTVVSKGNVEIRQAESEYKTAVVTITSDAGVKRKYTITFQTVLASGTPKGTRYMPVAIKAMDHDGNAPERTQDNDLSTRWTGKTTRYGWIDFDLGEDKVVDAVALAIHSGNSRAAIFDIMVSNDGETYTTVLENCRTSGTTTDMEHVVFEPQEVRYVRLVGYGATTSPYNSYSEIHIYKLD